MKSLTAFMGAVGMICCFELVSAQVSTIQSGNWNSPGIWSGGFVPDSSQLAITIAHPVSITEGMVIADELILQHTLTVGDKASLVLANSKSVSPDLQLTSMGVLDVYGKLICKDGATIVGTNALNNHFRSGAVYEHQYYLTAGEPPQADWDLNSTVLISGYTSSRSLNTAGWSQSFGHVEYNCPGQLASAFVEMLGNLKNINGNFAIRNTNGGVLRLTLDRTTLNTINIGGNFVIEGNSEVWFSREANTVINVGGDFEYRSTATPSSYLTTLGTCQLNVAGNAKINTRGILRFASNGGGTGTLRVKKNFDLQSGTLAVLPSGRGFIECNGNTYQSITLLGTVSPEVTFVINNSSGVEIGNNSVVSGSVQVSSGKLFLPLALTINGNLMVAEHASIDSNKGTVVLTGSLNQIVDLQGNTLHNLVVNKSPGTSVTLQSMMNLSGDLSIQSSNTDVIANGSLTLLSTSDAGEDDASISFLPSESEIVGDVTVQRFMSGEGRLYRYVSSAVSNASVASMQDDFPVTGTFENPSSGAGLSSQTPSLFWYDESMPGSSGWVPYPSSGLSENNPLVPGRGYAAFVRLANAPTVWDVTGIINQGEINLNASFHNTNSGSQDGWNLIGNPYPSSIDWDNEAGWQKENIANGIAIRDNGSGTVVYWDGDIGSMGSGRIATGQAFWVKANDGEPVLTVNENAKTNLSTPFFRQEAKDLDYLELTIQGAQHSDKAYLRLRHDASERLDHADIPKMNNDFINLAFIADSTLLAIHATNTLECLKAIPVRLYFPTTSTGTIVPDFKGEYTLAGAMTGLLHDASVTLHDAFTNTSSILNEGNYQFTITDNPDSYSITRFSLFVRVNGSLQQFSTEHDSVFCDADYGIKINNLSGAARAAVFVNHEKVKSFFLPDSSYHIIPLATASFHEGDNEVSLQVRNACASEMTTWTAASFKQPAIVQAGKTLISNHENGNQWFFNNEWIGDQQQLTPAHSGIYSVTTYANQCSASASYDFIYQDDGIQLFPNPASDQIFIVSPVDDCVLHLTLSDSFGKCIKDINPVENLKQHAVSLTDLPAGFYTVNVFTATNSYVVKLVKRN